MKQLLPLLLLLCLSANAQEQFTLYFDTDKDIPTETSSKQFTEWLDANKDANIQKIAGYTDTVGNTEYNRMLSIRRFKYVVTQLAERYMLKKFVIHTPGEKESLSGTNAQNRKAVITYTNPAVQPVPVAPVIAEQQKPVDSELSKQVASAKKGDKILLKNLNFYNNEDVMLPSSAPVMRELLKMLRENPKLKIQIQGHVCCEPENKIRLSRKRALAVYNFLISKGISKKRLSYTSFGSTKPIYAIPEKTEEERIANRRVEIEILEN